MLQGHSHFTCLSPAFTPSLLFKGVCYLEFKEFSLVGSRISYLKMQACVGYLPVYVSSPSQRLITDKVHSNVYFDSCASNRFQ